MTQIQPKLNFHSLYKISESLGGNQTHPPPNVCILIPPAQGVLC